MTPKSKKALVAILVLAALPVGAKLVKFVAKDNAAPVVAASSMPAPVPAAQTAQQAAQAQVIDIVAAGGYSPTFNLARADEPAIIRVTTTGSVDCSSALRIPELNYAGYLPLAGTVDIPVPPMPRGHEMTGLCSMGMYRFTISFD